MLGRSALWIHVLLILTDNVVSGQQLQPQTFQWGPALNQSSLTQCGTVNLMVYPLSGQTGTPPYYMFAYQPGGPTTSSLIGSDPNNLLWTVDHAAGSFVVLQVADSQGSTGGVGPTSYTVNPGSSSSCIPPSTSSVQITPSTSELSTCDPLVLDISGGEMPYMLTILSINDVAVTNITMGPSDNEYTYIDRLPSNSDGGLVAAVVDATGAWSTATNLIGLTGGSDTGCGGAQSSSGIKGSTSSSATTNHGTTPGQPSPTSGSSSSATSSTSSTAASSSKHSIIGPVVGGVVGALVVGVFGTILLICCFRRKPRKDPNGDYATDPEKKPDPLLLDDPSALTYANGAPTSAWAGNNMGSHAPQSQANMPSMPNGMGFVGGVNGYTHQGYNPQESQAIAAGGAAPFAYYQPTHSPSNSMSYSSDRSSRGLLDHQNGMHQDFAQHNYPQPSMPYNAHTGLTPLAPAEMSVSPAASNARTLYDIPQGAMVPASNTETYQGEREHHSDTPLPRPLAYSGVPEIQDDSHRST